MSEMRLSENFAKQLDALGPFEARPEIAVAVSGGADSMALCLLAQEWASAHGGKVIALTVDHRLREGSDKEAEQVGAWLKLCGIEHHILMWEHDEIPASGIPAAAREARYRLLGETCAKNGILHLLVAHHAFDQAETVALREQRGVKGDGLSGMSRITVREGVRILRPLLAVDPQALRDYLKAQNQEWVEDPSNQNMAFARNAMRQTLDARACAALCAKAEDAGRARIQNEQLLAQQMAEQIELQPEGWATWRTACDGDVNENVEIFSRIVRTIGSSDSMRWEEAQRVFTMLKNNTQSAATVGGCYIEWQHDYTHLMIMREQSSIQNALDIQASDMIWDGRFLVSARDKIEGVRIGALGHEDFLAVKQDVSPVWLKRLPRKVILTLPALKALEGVMKVPHIEYSNSAHPTLAVTIRWMPKRPLAGPPFVAAGA